MTVIKTVRHPSRRARVGFAGICALLFVVISMADGSTRASVFASPMATPTGALSGMHLGNHVASEDWGPDLLRRIDPRQGGILPQVLVVLSSQVYDRPRDLANECRLLNAYIPASRSGIRGYLQYASEHGVRIIIRIMPSPGNMNDLRHLSLAPQPENGDLCREFELPPNGDRSYDDIGEEIIKIHEWNALNNITEFGFEPANEPNLEWYETSDPQAVHRSNITAWSEMDAYFSAIYDYAHARYPTGIRVLTPPMSQGLYAEVKNVNGCGLMKLDGTENSHGYEYMPNVFMTGSKNDGYSWHNYWREGYEDWATCDSTASPHGQHVALWFPPQMLTSMQSKPRNITEADLASPQQNFGNPIANKDQQLGVPAAESIQKFIDREVIADHIAVWTLNVANPDPNAQEQQWHEAYGCNDFVWVDPSKVKPPLERPWFTRWWAGQTPSFQVTPCYRLFLSGIANNYPEELVKNGQFESGSAYWTVSRLPSCQRPMFKIYTDANGIENYAAVLGDCQGNVDTLYQTVTIPSNATSAKLRYNYQLITGYAGGIPTARMEVSIVDGSNSYLLDRYDDSGYDPVKYVWQSATFELASYAGKAIQVKFYANNSSAGWPASFWVDNVSLLVEH